VPQESKPPVIDIGPPLTQTFKGGSTITLQCKPSGPESSELECIAPSLTRIGDSPPDKWLEFGRKYQNSFLQVLADSVRVDPMAPHESSKSFQALGSAFFITIYGHFLTNAHVILKAMKIYVKRNSEGDRYLQSKILGVCPGKDIALCQLEMEEVESLKVPIEPLYFGDSDELEIPAPLAACGFPLGDGDVKMNLGNLSGFYRGSEGLDWDPNKVSSYLQITTPLAQGISGGCVINIHALVVGIASQGNLQAQNVGYAIPSKVVFSVLRSLFSTAYPDLIVPVPLFLEINWQNTNESSLRSFNVDPKYQGGLYVYGLSNCALPRVEGDLQEKDIIVEVRCSDPYSEEKNPLQVNTYMHTLFFPTLRSKQAQVQREEVKKRPLEDLQLIRTDIHQDEVSQRYLTAGNQWNLTEETQWPMLRVLFNKGDDTVRVQKQEGQGGEWQSMGIYARRKFFFTDFLDMLPSGIPLLFIVVRNGEKICISRRFFPTLPRYQGLRYIFPPFQPYTHYEIFAGLVFSTLFLNHFKVCLPHIVKRLEGPLRFQPAVIITNRLGLSSIARRGAMEPLSVAKTIELFAPRFDRESQDLRVRFESIYKSPIIVTIEDFRQSVSKLVDVGIQFFKEEVNPSLKRYESYLRRLLVHQQLQTLKDAKMAPQQIRQMLRVKYPTPSEQVIMEEKYGMETEDDESYYLEFAPKMEVGKSWYKILNVMLTFDEGPALFFTFPFVFAEDESIQHQLGISPTPFAQSIYAKIRNHLFLVFNKLFGSESSKTPIPTERVF
jgi:S1-C subfamily serine protease